MIMNSINYKERFYRDLSSNPDMRRFNIRTEETDLLVISDKDIRHELSEEVRRLREIIKNHIRHDPDFYTSLCPVQCRSSEEIISLMCDAAYMADTGPMACVAGAIAEVAGRKMLEISDNIFIENGGDIFAMMDRDFKAAVYAGDSPFSLKIGLMVRRSGSAVGVATSSGTVGHSYSMGNADAVTVISGSAAFADAAATSLGNEVEGRIDRKRLCERIEKLPCVQGALIIKGKEIFAWGDIEIAEL